ncbi:MAG: phosphate-starvation-inducible PsiE family protein [Rhodocyclaceae bacterium]
MEFNTVELSRIRRFFHGGLNLVEYLGLLVIAVATIIAGYQEVVAMVDAQRVNLADLLLLFLFLEVLAMVGRYFEQGQLPVRFPLYIAMVALARYIIIDVKEMTDLRMIVVAAAILVLALAVLALRYGHVRFPYREDSDGKRRR